MVSWPAKWGPYAWGMMHITALNFPDNADEHRKHSFVQYLKGMASNLPCPACSTHFHAYLVENPPDTSSRDKLQRWAWQAHNSVNRRLKKYEPTYEEANEALIRSLVDPDTNRELNWAQKMRQEDTKRICKVQTSLDQRDADM